MLGSFSTTPGQSKEGNKYSEKGEFIIKNSQ